MGKYEIVALKFKCKNCNEFVIIRFLKIGEVVKCFNCGAENIIPESAVQTDEEPKFPLISKDITPSDSTEAMGVGTQLNILMRYCILLLSLFFCMTLADISLPAFRNHVYKGAWIAFSIPTAIIYGLGLYALKSRPTVKKGKWAVIVAMLLMILGLIHWVAFLVDDLIIKQYL